MLDGDLIRTFNRRTLLLGGGKAVLLSFLMGRVFFLQVIESKKYRELSNKNAFRLHILIPLRGKITDRYDVVMADNDQRYSLFITPEQVQKSQTMEDMFNFFSEYLSFEEDDRIRILKTVKKQGDVLPVLVKGNMTWEEMAPIAMRQFDLPGLFIETDIVREYPLKESASHVIGYVGLDKKKTKYDQYRFLYRVPDFRTGRNGVEKEFDKRLTGEPGELIQKVNAHGRLSKTFKAEKKEAIAGKDLKLTLDTRLQKYASEVFFEKSGSVLVMDVHTGELLTMASFPEYDLTRFEGRIEAEYYKELLDNPYHPLINKPVEGLYAPGSTFKMLVALAGLHYEKITSSKEIFCPGYFWYGNHKFHCWEKRGHKHISLVDAIQKSCDVYFYQLGLEVGIDRIEEISRKFGLGEKTGIQLPTEKQGVVPNRYWKKEHMGESWVHGDTIMTSIGQGLTLTTPLQLAVMISRLVNGGKAVSPTLTARDNVNFEDMGFQAEHLDLIKKGMFNVVNEKHGTARGSAFDVAGMKMGGKTGTTQVRRISTQERLTSVRSQNSLDWRLRNHALFVGYAPADAPRYACCVVVEHGRGGSSTAAPVASKMLKKTLEIYTKGEKA
ncbi:MAG: penicillin-binding protein 2 [Alphaproteobacteria bacterium]|nr:penicillin-binding protein 2 [Alphaproteobacteria bacterium]